MPQLDRVVASDTAQASATTVFVMLAAVLIPAYLTLQTLQTNEVTGDLESHLGYTWSLTLFAVPLCWTIAGLLGARTSSFDAGSFIRTLAIMVPIGFLLDLAFAHSFFVFPNQDANLGIHVWGLSLDPIALSRSIPIEEFVFYVLGMALSLAFYIWADSVWLRTRVDNSRVSPPIQLNLDPRPIAISITLAIVATLYKKLGSHGYTEGYPWYLYFLLTFAFTPAAVIYRAVRPLVNWQALSLSIFAMLVVSLFWEACLALPLGWWGYRSDAMLGVFIGAWQSPTAGHALGHAPGLPLEAVVVWIQVSFSMTFVYEFIRAKRR